MHVVGAALHRSRATSRPAPGQRASSHPRRRPGRIRPLPRSQGSSWEPPSRPVPGRPPVSHVTGEAARSGAAVGSPEPRSPHRLREQEAPMAGRPNILIIWGDDIGITNLSCYSDGLMGYRTPTLTGSPTRGTVHRLLRRAELHRRPGGVDHRAEGVPDRPLEGRYAGRRHRPAGRGPHHRRALKARVLHRPVRQEPLRRQGRVPAHMHGFDEFFGNLYHLNAEEEPEH